MVFRRLFIFCKQGVCIISRISIISAVVSIFTLSYSEEGFGWSNIFALVDQEIAISTEVSPEQNLQFRITSHLTLGRVSFHINLIKENISARLCIYTIQGKCVEIITLKGGGTFNFHWNGKDGQGENAAAGIYYARLITADNTVSKKFLFMRQ